MKIYIEIIIGAQILMGVLFLLNSATDIQFGFGTVLLLMGLANIPSVLQK